MTATTPTAPPLRLGLIYDFRNRPDSGISTPDLYAGILDQIVFADQLGYDLIWLTEHHFVEDGYLPSFVPVAGAIAARTSRVRISTDIALLPFHNALRLAEDLAVLDNISGGRMELGVGMGYAEHEFRAFGIPRPRRVSLTEEGLAVLRGAWADEPLDFHGKRYSFDRLPVYPKPVQPGGPPLWLAAQSTPGAQRAARLGLNLLPQGSRAQVLEPWRDAVAAEGRHPHQHRVGINRSAFVTDDRERDWPDSRAGEIYRAKMYRAWSQSSDDKDLNAWDAEDKIPQDWVVGDADHVVATLTEFVLEHGITDLVSWGSPPGVDPASRYASIEAFAKDVAPRLRANVAAARGTAAAV